MQVIVKCFLIVVFLASLVKGANILAVIPSPFYSHQSTWRPLWTSLAKNHYVILMTTNPMEYNENITQIDTSEAHEIMKRSNFIKILSGESELGFFEQLELMRTFFDDLWNLHYNHPDLKPIDKVDLLFVEVIMPGYSMLSYKFKCPYIALSPMDGHPFVHGWFGNSLHPAIYPFINLGYAGKLSIKERIVSTAVTIGHFVLERIMGFHVRNLALDHFGKDVPEDREVVANASLLFIKANPVIFPDRPVVSKTVNVEGLHLTEPQPLPKDLQDFLDDSKDGCIYISFGTAVSFKDISEQSILNMISVLQELAPMKVFWKFNNETKIKPSNIKFVKWLPQQDVLRHPNVRAFVTHGGLQSMEEAIDSGVPVLGIPFYGDQIHNVNQMVQRGIGVRLNKQDINRESFKRSLSEILNVKYLENAKRLSEISKDRPVSGLEKAVWWTEYLLRHKSTDHLNSPSADIPFYQYFYIDIGLIAVSLVLIVFYTLKYVSRKLIRKIKTE